MSSSVVAVDALLGRGTTRNRPPSLCSILCLQKHCCSVLGPAFYLPGIHDLAHLGQVSVELSRVCRCKVFLKKILVRNLNMLLEQFALEYESLCTILRNTGSLLSGSMLHHCAEGDHILHGSDLDIYVPYEKADTVRNYLQHDCGYTEITLNGPINRSCDPADEDCMDYDDVNLQLISNVYKFEGFVTGRKIDVIVMHRRIPPKAAVAQFDFSFLMSVFDGHCFYFWFPGDIIQRSGFHNEVQFQRQRLLSLLVHADPGSCFFMFKARMRLLRYMWITWPNDGELGHSWCADMTIRREKYFERGYRVHGDQPPVLFDISIPPWTWGPKGKAQRLCTNARVDKIRKRIGYPWRFIVKVASLHGETVH